MRLLLLILATACFASGGEVAGRVLASTSGEPVGSADVRVHRKSIERLSLETETDSHGRFGAQGLDTADYRVEISKVGYIPTAVDVRIEGSVATTLTIRLVRCGGVSGHVTDDHGAPVGGAHVYAVRGPRMEDRERLHNPFFGEPVISGRDGSYRLPNLPPGEYALAVSYGASPRAMGSAGHALTPAHVGSGFAILPRDDDPRYYPITGGEQYTVDITIHAAALFRVAGRVQILAQKGIFWAALASVRHPFVAVDVTAMDESGEFAFQDVPSGEYFLFVSGPVRGRNFLGGSLESGPMFVRERIHVSQDLTGLVLSPDHGLKAAVRLEIQRGSEAACPERTAVNVANIEDWGVSLFQRVAVGIHEDTPIANLAPGKYALTADALGENCYQAGETIMDLSAGQAATVAVRVGAAGSILGQLPGGPSRNGPITLQGGDMNRAVIPDAEGRFAFEGLAPGVYRLMILQDQADASREVRVSAGESVRVVLPFH